MKRVSRSLFSLALLMSACITPPPIDDPTDTVEQAADVAWVGKPIGELYRKGEVRAFVYKVEGQTVGRTWGRYEGTQTTEAGRTLHRFTTRIEEALPEREPLRGAGEIWLTDDGELVRGYERSPGVQLDFEVESGTFTMSVAGQPDQRESMSFPPGSAYQAYMSTLHEEINYGRRDLTPGETLEWKLVSLSGAAPHPWQGDVSTLPTGEIVIETNLGSRVELVDGRVRSILVQDDKLTVDVTSDPWPKWEVKGPKQLRYEKPSDATFSIRPVELPGKADESKLFGEVLVPEGAAKAPAVVFLADSGLTDRYGFAGPPPVDIGYHEITDALAQAGFVVLRYDEPGFGESPDTPLSWEGQLEHARRALSTLSVQDEVDPDKMIVMGHGAGGWRALKLAVERKRDIAGVAVLATPGRPMREDLQRRAQATLRRLDPASREKAKEQHEALIRAIETGEGIPPEFDRQGTWLREVFDFDPRKVAKKVKAKVWVAQGGKDFEVDPDDAPLQLTRALGKRGSLARFAALDHQFKVEPGQSRPERYLEDRPVDPEFLAALIEFARSVVQ